MNNYSSSNEATNFSMCIHVRKYSAAVNCNFVKNVLKCHGTLSEGHFIHLFVMSLTKDTSTEHRIEYTCVTPYMHLHALLVCENM